MRRQTADVLVIGSGIAGLTFALKAAAHATVHVVTQEYDTGPPILQREVPVLPGDTPETLAARVFAVECQLYPEAIRCYMTAHPELKRS